MSLFSTLANAVKAVVNDIRKVNFVTLLGDLIGYVPALISEFDATLQGLKDKSPDALKKLIDDGLDEFDNETELANDDSQAPLHLLKGIPRDKAEEALDHFKELVRIILYCKSKVPGYFE